jgi:hypothetical protein
VDLWIREWHIHVAELPSFDFSVLCATFYSLLYEQANAARKRIKNKQRFNRWQQVNTKYKQRTFRWQSAEQYQIIPHAAHFSSFISSPCDSVATPPL